MQQLAFKNYLRESQLFVGRVITTGLIVILLASLYPAWFATRKEPIDALRTF